MTEISKPNTRAHWIVTDGTTTHVGVTEPYQVTSTGLPQMHSDADPEAFVAKVEANNLTAALPPLPAEGEEVEKDAVYSHNGKAVICYQTHTRTHFDPADTPALFGRAKSAGDPWVQPLGAHDAYAQGAVVTHNGQTWTSTTDGNVWEPGVFGWVL